MTEAWLLGAGKFAVMMCLAALGYVIADVAADGLTVEFARREPVSSSLLLMLIIMTVRQQ